MPAPRKHRTSTAQLGQFLQPGKSPIDSYRINGSMYRVLESGHIDVKSFNLLNLTCSCWPSIQPKPKLSSMSGPLVCQVLVSNRLLQCQNWTSISAC
jgi:hypothetical protein